MIKGIDIELGGTTYTVPPLTLGAVERLGPQIEALNAASGEIAAQFAPALDIATAAFQRNYPEMTRDQVGELVDLHNMRAILEAAMGAKPRAAALESPPAAAA